MNHQLTEFCSANAHQAPENQFYNWQHQHDGKRQRDYRHYPRQWTSYCGHFPSLSPAAVCHRHLPTAHRDVIRPINTKMTNVVQTTMSAPWNISVATAIGENIGKRFAPSINAASKSWTTGKASRKNHHCKTTSRTQQDPHQEEVPPEFQVVEIIIFCSMPQDALFNRIFEMYKTVIIFVTSGSIPPPAKILRQITAAPTNEMAIGTNINVLATTPQRIWFCQHRDQQTKQIQTDGTNIVIIRLLRKHNGIAGKSSRFLLPETVVA